LEGILQHVANLVAESGGNKGQLSNFVEAICYDFRQHGEAELKKLVARMAIIDRLAKR